MFPRARCLISGTHRPRPGRVFLVALGLGLCLVVLTACARSARIQTPAPVVTSNDLVGALRSAGAQVQEASSAEAPVLEVSARAITVDGEQILVYEYASEQDRRAVSDSISLGNPTTVGGRILDWPTTPRAWATGQLVIAYLGRNGGTILLLNSLLGDPLAAAEPGVDEPYPPAVAVAIERLASELGVNPAWIEVRSFDPVDWPDACLGRPGADELCGEVVTSGWRVVLRFEGTVYEAHTDQLGKQIRLK